jgi:phage-related minor tail protein
LNETNVTPQINSASIDSALQKTQALERSLARVNGGASPNNTIAPHLRGQRARGGPITRGATYLAGEHGPELITASRSGYVHTAGQTAGMSGGTVNFAPNFTFHNTRAEDANAITSKVRDVLRQEVREMFRGAYADTGMRFS